MASKPRNAPEQEEALPGNAEAERTMLGYGLEAAFEEARDPALISTCKEL
jgi:hypothetical protein